jgi:hypothetical protein
VPAGSHSTFNNQVSNNKQGYVAKLILLQKPAEPELTAGHLLDSTLLLAWTFFYSAVQAD